MSTAILVLNAGSSSLKFSLFFESDEGLRARLRGEIEGLYTSPQFFAYDPKRVGHDGAIAYLLEFLRAELGAEALGAVGHRVAHGGADFFAPVRVTADIVAALERLVPLAPLHQSHNLRGGSLDPGIVLYCLTELGMDASAIEDLLYRQSGLLGVSGISSDMRTLLANDSSDASDAVDLFVYRCGRELGSLAAALGGIDALVFTAGIGENAAGRSGSGCAAMRNSWASISMQARMLRAGPASARRARGFPRG